MSSIFPLNPQTGDKFTVGTTTYQWTGYAWIKTAESAQLTNLTLQNLTATSSIVVTSSTNAISTVSGAFQVVGGVGIGGDLWVGGLVHINNTSTIAGAQIITTATLNNYVLQPVFIAGTGTAITTSTSGGTEIVNIWSTATLQDVTNRGYTTTNRINISNLTNATSTVSGALVVGGGVAIGGDLWLGGTLYSGGLPVITTSSLIESITAGPDILVTATTGLLPGTIAIIISNTSTLQTVTGRGSTTTNQVTFQNKTFFTDTTESTSSSTGAVVISGGLGVAKRINSESVQIADTVMDSGNVLVNTTDTVVVDAYSVGLYRSAKYLIQITDGTGSGASFETIEILLLVDNNQTVYATEYAVLSSNGELGEFAADVQGDNMVRLYFTAYQASDKVIKIFRTGMTV
jgi:hypothetical protein